MLRVKAFFTSTVLSISLLVSVCALPARGQTLQATDPIKLGYICQGDPQPEGYSIVAVSPAPSIQCGLTRATLFIEKTKSGLIVCGSSAALAGYTLHTLDYIVAGVTSAPCPGLPGQQGWIIERLGIVNTVCRLTNVLGTQLVVPPGYVVTGISSGSTASCPGPIVTIKKPGDTETVCNPFHIEVIVNATYSIPLGYSTTPATSSQCPGNDAFLIERVSKPKKLFNGASFQLVPSSCAIEGSIRSISFDTVTFIEFINTSSTTVGIYWIDYDGQRVFYNSLAPGQSYVQETFVTHPWVVTDANNNCLGIYFPIEESARVVVP